MAQSPEMESPSACQEYLVEAQEDSTSVDLASASSTTTMTTTMTTTLAEDAARQPVNENLCDLVMVCERINENSEKGELEERQSSGNLYSEKKEKEEDAKEKEEKEVDQRMEDTASEDKEDSMKEFLQEPEESGVRAVTPHDLDDEETRLKDSTCISRKRSAESDFLPIGGEVKRMGLEISEEQAMQLKNDIRRLSPVLVSMRERTLGEVSLTSESCSFKNDFVGGKTMSKDNDSYDESLQRNESSIENCARKDVDEAKHEVVAKVDASFSAERTSCENVESASDREEGKVVCDSQQESLDVDVASSCDGFDETMESNRHDDVTDTRSASGVSAEKCVDETAVVSSLVCRPLSVILNRIEDADVIKTKDGAVEKDSLYSERKTNLAEEGCSVSKKQQWHNDSSPMTRSRASELELVRSPNNLVLKKCKVVLKRINDGVAQPVNADETGSTPQKLEKNEPAPVSVIGQLEEDEEVVLASSSLSGERDRVFNELDSSETMPSSPEEMSEPMMDVVESVDTETETETGSDSSEVSPIASIRELRDVDIASNQLPCPEAEPLCCVEAMAPIMRLETDRPETYTEDSAESLALATGARDDVRSDGSDSGLGNEIPGDSGPAPAPESDSETSFLDRLPDDILSDKEKGMNQLDNFATSSDAPGIPEQPPMTSFRTLPAKSNLKRRLIDCMESEHESQSNTEEPMKKKRNIHFDAVTVYYFPRAQGFTCVPSQGGSTLGMSATHTHAERFSLSEHAAEQRRLHRARLAQLRSERNCAINCVTETASSSEDPSDDTDEEPSDNEDLDIDSYYFLQPVPTSQRRALLRAAGVRRIDAVEKDECRDIRASREHCGCGCKGYCDPESCPCSRANVKCQVDRPGFPCGCTRDGCANSSGRIEFNPIRVRTHFIHTLMRLELEKKQREEEGNGGDHDQTDNQGHGSRSGNGSLRNIGSLGSVMDTAGSGDVCTIPGPGGEGGGGFTTLHYETSHDSVTGIVTASCQPEVPGTREDSLDLYAIRDDCYPSEDAVDGSQSIVQRKLHPEFSQAFQSFSPGGAQNSGGNGGGMSFQQSSYQDYGSPYAGLPSSSRVPQFQPPQFQSPVPAPPNPAAFSHYGPYSVAQNTASAGLQGNCAAQVHQVPPPGQQQQHSSYETAVFAQDDATSTTQYTNLTNSVQPMNASVVQQMQQNKLEPFSELLSGRYSYYGEMHEPQQHHGTYGTHGATSKVAEIVEPGQVAAEQSESMPEDCDENFGEIIKKSMVETVSA